MSQRRCIQAGVADEAVCSQNRRPFSACNRGIADGRGIHAHSVGRVADRRGEVSGRIGAFPEGTGVEPGGAGASVMITGWLDRVTPIRTPALVDAKNAFAIISIPFDPTPLNAAFQTG